MSLFVAVNGLPQWAGPYAAKVAKVNILPSDGDTGKDPVSGQLFLKQTPAGKKLNVYCYNMPYFIALS